MAKIMNKSNHLEKKYRTYYLLALISILAGYPIVYITRFSMLFGVCFFTAIILANQGSKYYSGAKGEKKARKLLQSLPENYYVFTDLTIEFEDKLSQLDMVVVSENGISIVEVKNVKGGIVGDIEDKNWVQHKVGQKGGKYTKTFYNPVKQVGTHTFRLSKILKEIGVNGWVNNAVFFTDPEAYVDISNSTGKPMHIFSSRQSRELISFLCDNSRKKITEEEVQRVVSYLVTKQGNYRSK